MLLKRFVSAVAITTVDRCSLAANPGGTPSIICLDAGLAYEVQRHTRMVEILGALMMRDGRTAGRRMLTPASSNDDEE